MAFQIFRADQHPFEVSTVTLDQVPWFKGNEVAACLGYANPQQALRTNVDEDDRKTYAELAEGVLPGSTLPKQQPHEVSPPARRGRPPGSKDKAPRKRPARAVSPEVHEAPRPVTRRAPKRAPRRVQIVEEESDYSSAEDVPPSPRTRRHQEWTAYRQQQADTHQANVNRYASMFDRMFA